MQTSPRLTVLTASHRLAFLVGTVNFAVLILWWLLQLAGLWPDSGEITSHLLHGPAMIYLVFPPLIAGFLMTVFPRWMGFPDLGFAAYGPVALLFAAGSLAVHSGLWAGLTGAVAVGLIIVALGWLALLWRLGEVMVANRRARHGEVIHSWSAMGGLILGLAGLICAIAYVLTSDPTMWFAANRIGLFGFLLPVFLTVAHRMIPFFAGNVVAGYVRWRPGWLLWVLWVLLAVRLVAELTGLWLAGLGAATGLAAVAAFTLWKWWPRGPMPGILATLFWGLLWAPVGFAMEAALDLGAPLSFAPDHALFLGFAGSLVVAMVTRVTQGHSGRPITMSAPGWIAWAGVQAATILRIVSALRGDLSTLLILTSAVLLIGLLPWCIHHSLIYVRPRIDGRPG